MKQPHRIELTPIARKDAMSSLQQYCDENLSTADGNQPLGELPASLLLDFILEEIGPAIYNRAISDAQARLQLRVADLAGELYLDEFQYWPNLEKKRKARR